MAQLWARRTRKRRARRPQSCIRRRGKKPQEGTSLDDQRLAQGLTDEQLGSAGTPPGASTLSGRTTKTESVRVQTRTARANARVHAGAQAHVGTLDPSQAISGRKLRKHRQRFRELLAEAEPQGLAKTGSAAKWSERPRAIGRKRSQTFSAPVRSGTPQGPGHRVQRSKRERQRISLYVWYRVIAEGTSNHTAAR